MTGIKEQLVNIPIDSITLEGNLNIPTNARGIVVFVHGSGSSRLSPRNKYVADVLNKQGFATLLFDLLTEKEDETYENRFDIELLAKRLKKVTNWIKQQKEIKNLNIGYFGASTGAAGAIIGATNEDVKINAIVSRGGRPDLAGESLSKLKSPILLIVGGNDYDVIVLNKEASEQITSKKEISIVDGATHLFEETGALEQVADLATKWFKKYL